MSRLRLWLAFLMTAAVIAPGSAQVTSNKSAVALGSIRVYTTKTDSFKVSNAYAVPVGITAVTNVSPRFTLTSSKGSLTTSLTAGDSAWYRVTFAPDSIGLALDTVVVTHDSGTIKVALSGAGTNNVVFQTAAGAALATKALANSFATVGVKDSFLLKNNGTYSINVTAFTNANPEFQFTPAPPFALDSTVLVYVDYLGTAIGLDRDTLVVAHNDSAKASSPIRLPLSARAWGNQRLYTFNTLGSPAGTLLDDVDFLALNAGSTYGARNGATTPAFGVDSTRSARVALINRGADTVWVDSIRFTTPEFKNLVPTPFPQRSGASYDVPIYFEFNAKTVGDFVDTLLIFTNDSIPGSNPLRLVVKASTTRRVHVVNSANAATLAFGDVSLGTVATGTLRLMNKQDISLTVDSVTVTGNNPKFSVLTPLTDKVEDAGATDTILVQFSAVDTAGGPSFADTLLVYVPAYSGTPLRIPLSAKVVTNIVRVPSVTSINVGDLAVSNFKDTTIWIFNRTKDNFTVGPVSLISGTQYVIQSNTASQSLNAGDSADVVVRFQPSAGGVHRDTILISHNIDSVRLYPSPFRIALTGTGNTNAVIDPIDYLTVDNASGIEGFPISSADSSYIEVGRFWQNASGFQGTHRRTPNLDGSGSGSNATFTFTVDSTGPYLWYHYMVNSTNGATNAQVSFRKFGVGGIFDSLRYNQQEGNATGYGAAWFPLTMHHYNGVGPQAAQLTLGADNITTGFTRVDAARMLRSRLAVDLEFGRRDANFGPVRIPEEFPQITVGDKFVRPYRLYNLGTDTLVITDVQFYSTVTPVPWFYLEGYTPGQDIVIPPMVPTSATTETGGFVDIQLAFAPYQEGTARDSMVITSNDTKETKAYIVMSGVGVNYNFIMNASVGGTEPHYRAPGPPDVPTIPTYTEITSGFLSSTAGGLFPVPGQNLRSRVHVGDATTLPHTVFYSFELPDQVFGIDLFGDYILEHNGPSGSSNGHARMKTIVTQTFGLPADSGEYSALTAGRPAEWVQVGGSLKTFKLSPGGAITVTVTRDGTTDVAGASNLHRIDLMRMRKVPTGALIGVNVAVGGTIGFGEVNFRNPAGPTGQLNKKKIIIGSRGESQLEINNMRFRNGARFSIVNAPPAYPTYLRAVNGELELTIAFTPDKIAPAYGDTLEIVSNSTRDSLLLIPVTGIGIGGVFVVDDNNPGDEWASHPFTGGNYTSTWDEGNLNHWQSHFVVKPDSIGIGQTRKLLAMELYRNGWYEWYPQLPAEEGAGDSMYVRITATVGAGLTKAAPAARYRVFRPGVPGSRDTVVSQNGRTAGSRGVAEIELGTYWFLRGGRDSKKDTVQGAGVPIFGHVRVEVDTAAANFAGLDTLALVADAILVYEQERPSQTVGVETVNDIPTDFALDQNYPNPFNPSTTIRFALPIRATVEMKIFDLLGREVRTLIKGDQINPGTHSIVWDGRNSAGTTVATGVYFYRIDAAGFTQSKKMLLIK